MRNRTPHLRLDPMSARLAARILRDGRHDRKALRTMPRPAPWDWVKPRLVPLLAGPFIDPPDLATVRGVSELGPALVYGVDVGRVYPLVDVEVAERWEVSVDQLHDAAMDNFRARAARTPPSCVTRGTMSGWITTFVRTPAGLASSLVLVPEELRRLVGERDQLVATPTRALLLAMPIDAPLRTFAEVAVEFEGKDPLPLWLDPFALIDGGLTWTGAVRGDDDQCDADEFRARR
jgi:hypothetical protein